MYGSNASSRGDTQEFSDFNKLAKRFLRGGQDAELGESNNTPSKAYIQAVVEEMRRGEKGECPICLEVFEDAVLTPCAHQLCRECLLASWRNAMSGLCPVCRYLLLSFQDFLSCMIFIVVIVFIYVIRQQINISKLQPRIYFYLFTGKPLAGKILLRPPQKVDFKLILKRTGWNPQRYLLFCRNWKIFAQQAPRALSLASGLHF